MGDTLAKVGIRFKLPGFKHTMHGDVCDPRALRIVCQELVAWLRLFECGNDQTCRPQCLEIPRKQTMIRTSLDQLITYIEPGNVGSVELAIVAHFAPDGGDGIDLLDCPARCARLIKAGMSHAGNEATTRLEYPRYFLNGSGGILHVHQSHVTHHHIACVCCQHVQMRG